MSYNDKEQRKAEKKSDKPEEKSRKPGYDPRKMARNIDYHQEKIPPFFAPIEKTGEEAEEDTGEPDDGLHFIHYLSEEE